jgi:hypothetical protein
MIVVSIVSIVRRSRGRGYFSEVTQVGSRDSNGRAGN